MSTKPVIFLAVLFLATLGACDQFVEDVEDEIDDQEVDVEINLFDDNYLQDQLNISLAADGDVFEVDQPMDLDVKQSLYADYRLVATVPAEGMTADMIRELADLADIMDYLVFDGLWYEGSLHNYGTAPALFEVRIANDATLGDVQAILNNSTPLFSITIAPGEEFNLAEIDEFQYDMAAVFVEYELANPPDLTNNYYLFTGAYSVEPLDLSVGRFNVLGTGFYHNSMEVDPGELSRYSNNLKEVLNVALSGTITNNNQTDPVTAVIAAGAPSLPDDDPIVFEDLTRWMFLAEVPAGETLELEGSADVDTEYTDSLLDWMMDEMLAGREVQVDLGVWCESDINVTMDVKIDATIEVGL